MKICRFFLLALFIGFTSFARAESERSDLFNELSHHFDSSDASVTIPCTELRIAIGIMAGYLDQMKNALNDDEEAAGWDWSLPNLVYTQEAEAAIVATDLRIRKVAPLDAIVLIAAAADCELKPILSPDEAFYSRSDNEGAAFFGAGGQKIIGYQIVKTPCLPADFTSQVLPSANLRNSEYGDHEGFGDEGFSGEGEFGRLGSIASETDSIEGNTRAADTGGFGNRGLDHTPSEKSKRATIVGDFLQVSGSSASSLTTPTTSIFFLGELLGNDEAANEEQEAILEQLIIEALKVAEIEGDLLTLSFHRPSDTMIVKANEKQLGIIEQAIDALKQKRSASNEDF